MFGGIDWATAEHAVAVHSDDGVKRWCCAIAHSQEGLERLVTWLAQFGDPADLPIAIERPDGRLIDRLLEAGHPVVAVKTTAIKAWRESEVPSGAKSDPGDADVIADYLRVRHHQLRVLAPFGAATKALRTVVRARDDLVDQRVTAIHQLTALLDGFWPGAKHIFADIESPTALSFLERYPTPASAARLGQKRLAAFCAKVGYSGGRTPAELLARLRAAPAGVTDAAIKDLERCIRAGLDEHPDGELFTSLPRSGMVNAAQLLAEWGDCRDAYAGPESISALAGQAPVTKKSGKHRSVSFRWACNKRFRDAMHTFADNSRHASPWAARVYADAKARHHDHQHALRILGRAWIRVIYRCWLDGVPYDAALHGAASRLAQDVADQEVAA